MKLMNKSRFVSCETFLRMLAVFVATAALGLSLVSCGKPTYSEDDLRGAVLDLLPRSLELNEIYFGEGLPISDNREDVERFYASFATDVTAVNYHPVADDCEYQSVADIKAATEAVFSEQYCVYLYELAFQGISAVFNEGEENQYTSSASYARYIENSGILTVRLDIIYEAMDLSRTYDMDSMEIVTMRRSYAIVNVPSEKNGETVTIELKLIYTDDGFRLDTPTY